MVTYYNVYDLHIIHIEMSNVANLVSNVQNRNDISNDTHDQFLFWICSSTSSKYRGSHSLIYYIYPTIKHKEAYYFMVYI